MRGFLVRAGIDHSYGNWNAPVDPASREFVYVPIPEGKNTTFFDSLETPYQQIIPDLNKFCSEKNLDLRTGLRFPEELKKQMMHLDPDFEKLTYGDWANRRGKGISQLDNGDLIVFYAGLKPTAQCGHKLIYALIGIYIVEEIVPLKLINRERWFENAHTRRKLHDSAEIIVRAKTKLSGRLENCIPFGEWRDRAYRVKKDLLEKWGGLSVADGYVQRSAVPPSFLDATKFYKWFQSQNIKLIPQNNL
jgi:hypothetical protein